MSESYGNVLTLKRHEDLEKVATYVKQQVREKSLELLGEDLSVNSDFVGLIIDEEENNITMATWNTASSSTARRPRSTMT